MKHLFKYISFFMLLINGAGSMYAGQTATHSALYHSDDCRLEVSDSDFETSAHATIHEDSDSFPKREFSETKEFEIEELQNDNNDALDKFTPSRASFTALFYTFLSSYHDFSNKDRITLYAQKQNNTSYQAICVRFCVFRL